MATGYTYRIKDGISFNDFVMDCAKAMGACIMMRDEPASTPIPEVFEPDDYHKNAYEKAKKELGKFCRMTKKAAEEKTAKYNDDRKVAEREAECKDKELSEKYLAMIEKVENWEPPTNDHIEFKHFMLDQLKESLRFDCGYTRSVTVEDISVEEWKSQKESSILHDIEYHKKNYAEEVERAKERTAWISDLRNSLKEAK